MKSFIFFPCIFHLVTGYYCPGCGGTRSVFFLLHGDFLRSFIYHPLVLYVLFALLYNFIRFLFNKKYHPKAIWLWVALIIVILNFVVKNVALVFGIDLLAI